MSPDERKLLQQSKEATEAAEIDDGDQLRIAGMVNGDIMTDSESDNPSAYSSITSESGKQLILKKRRVAKRRMKRLQSKNHC